MKKIYQDTIWMSREVYGRGRRKEYKVILQIMREMGGRDLCSVDHPSFFPKLIPADVSPGDRTLRQPSPGGWLGSPWPAVTSSLDLARSWSRSMRPRTGTPPAPGPSTGQLQHFKFLFKHSRLPKNWRKYCTSFCTVLKKTVCRKIFFFAFEEFGRYSHAL